MPASLGAGLALLAVVALGFVLHRPLASIPENTLKFGVGVLLSAFGSFWVAEGIGLVWPGGDWAIVALIGAYLVVSLALARLCAQLHRTRAERAKPALRTDAKEHGALETIARELWGLFVDDAWLAGGVVAWVLAAWAAHASAGLSVAWICVLLAAGLNLVLAASAARRAAT